MTDHIGEATQKVIDLDALEKRLRDATFGVVHPKSARFSTTAILSEDLESALALIDELKMTQGLLSQVRGFLSSDPLGIAMLDRINAFLARNGKGEGEG